MVYEEEVSKMAARIGKLKLFKIGGIYKTFKNSN